MNNKLFIIGNGFDLAHGLKTSYQHFFIWYFNQAIKQFNTGVHYNDGFILGVVTSKLPILEINDVTEINNLLKNGKDKTFLLLNPWANYFNISLKDLNWVDFEILYFELIKEVVYEASYDKRTKIGSIAEINKIFNMFKLKLTEYLTTLDMKVKEIIRSPFYNHISQRASESTTKPNALILNFNYTKTFEQVLSEDFSNNPKHFFNFSHPINIHGELNSIKNPIIFGYGDEMDDGYKSLEKLNDNEVLRFMKSFGYVMNNNYKFLDAFIGEDFDVHILGHSCGLSDRLLMNEIFESNGCKNIYFHYWRKSESENNFVEITMNISRCFNEKSTMRKKVRSFEECVPFNLY